MSGDPASAIRRRDDLLELLYWIEGEGFSGAATPAELARLLVESEAEIRRLLAVLADRGEVVENAAGEFRLTDPGRREAARRFADSFGPLLGQGHFACRDPDCECHTAGPEHCRSRPAAE
ncbi:MAG TPA: hypothetical protein VNI83_05105 [Vicinamibacterales bacterium]|nr:hypothetical protein [Vicinamibacterales bacterium]